MVQRLRKLAQVRHHEDKSHKPRYCILLEFCKLLYVMFIYSHTARQRFLKTLFSFFQMPCDEGWKREELKRYLLRSPILQWEGSPIQHMGQPAYLSLVHISNTQRQVSERCQGNTHEPLITYTFIKMWVCLLQGSQERLFVLFPLDLLILSVDSQRLWIKYEVMHYVPGKTH